MHALIKLTCLLAHILAISLSLYLYLSLLLFKGVCTHGNVRLVGGYSEYEGRLELCYNGQWSTVCNNGADLRGHAATVVCSQLGFDTDGRTFMTYQFLIIITNWFQLKHDFVSWDFVPI